MNTKKCPFCAHDETGFKTVMISGKGHYEYQVTCRNCDAYSSSELSKKQAVKSWNMRREVDPSVQTDADVSLQNATKPCPFCGCYSIKFEEVLTAHRVVCENCDSCGPIKSDQEQAIEGWNAVCEMHETAKVDAEAYDDLRNATPVELLEATIWYYRETVEAPAAGERMISFLRLGFQLARPGGWERVAPQWLRESRKIAALDVEGE